VNNYVIGKNEYCMRITIKDIARELDLHHSTVSRALHDDPRVKSATRKRIRDYAQKHGYRLNVYAANFRSNSSNVVALIIPNNNHNFFSNIVYYLTNLAYENDMVISIFQSNESYEQERRIIEKVILQNMAGVIVSISNQTVKDDHFRELLDMQIPLVFFDRVIEHMDAAMVETNNRQVVGDLTRHMIKSGRKRIVHLTGPDTINVFRERSRGYMDAVVECDMSYRKNIVFSDDFTMEAGVEAVRALFSERDRPDAILSSSSFLTFGLVKEMKQQGIDIHGTVALAGFGEHTFNEMLHPGIITVEQPVELMAFSTFELLTNQLACKQNGTPLVIKKIVLESKIVF
jgi:LacI family transcriptional regulator